MYENEINEKMKAAQDHGAGQCVTTDPYPQNYGDCVQTREPMPMTDAESRIYGLSGQISHHTTQKERSERVLDILTRHPEFHEFLEVLRSGLV